MIKIYIDNVYALVEGASKEIENLIWTELSFEVQEFGQEFVKRRHLFNRKTKKTYVGLLSYIEDILKKEEQNYEIIDNRIKHEPNANFKLKDYLDLPDGEKVKLELRPYQKDIIDNAEEREVIQAATGAGKTVIMAGLIDKFNVKPVSVFADKLSLCTQIKEEFEKFLGIPIGIVGGGINQKEDITIYSTQSATEEDIKDSKMIMFDECLSGDTLITLSDGSNKTIMDIVENKLECDLVTYNTINKCFEINKVYNWSKTPIKDKKMMELVIEDDNGNEYKIRCTNNHKIWIESENKYIRADELKKNMEVIINESNI